MLIKKKKKRTSHQMDVPVDHREKVKENEQIDKYWDLARELKKLWNMRVTVIPIIVGALRTVPKGLEKRLEERQIRGRIETIQTIVSIVWEICLPDSSERPPADASVKKLTKSEKKMIIKMMMMVMMKILHFSVNILYKK